MKKFGFTLAEVLVTLGIVGIVSALTIPTLVSNTTDVQIGPKLAKAVSTFEQANEALLNANASDTLSDINLTRNLGQYRNTLMNFLKGSIQGNNFLTKDGIQYRFEITDANPDSGNPAHRQRIGVVVININGATRPNSNTFGTDLFEFSWWNDGSLRPRGGTNWDGSGISAGGGHWTTDCQAGVRPGVPNSCAGHIFENNLRVLYK